MKAITKLIKKSQVSRTPAKSALKASQYVSLIRQYGDKGYVPSNGVGVGGNKNGEGTTQWEKSDVKGGKEKIFYPAGMTPNQKLKTTPPKKKQYTPSNAGYSKFA